MLSEPLNPQDALIAVMIATSAADERMTPSEFHEISAIVQVLPIFDGYDVDRIGRVGAMVSDLFREEEGLDALLGLVGEALPDRLRETAYALACDVAAADLRVPMTERRMLEELRDHLDLDRLASAAIERGSRARHQRMLHAETS
ncbi:MAG TPA: tellurite resistance TerB family protein [Paracoccaceae bacterium]|nr:tellurite resistance TerB family protein [Paracoccaceae bacterium]